MNCELCLLVDFVESDGFFQLALRADRTGVTLLIYPLHGEGIGSWEAADFPHLALEVVVPDRVIDVSDEDLAEKRNFELHSTNNKLN